MSRNKRIPSGRAINPTFFVFCEGNTEEAYISHLRSKYRLPIVIDAKVAGNRITEKYISNHKKDKATHPKDNNYLVYDLDVPEMLEKLTSIKNTILLSSNPCFELWYLLHFQEQKSEISSNDCIAKLKQKLPKYNKGTLNKDLKDSLEQGQAKAVNRASKLNQFANPSSQIFLLIHDIEKVKKQINKR
jgi:hypothetical protein